MKTQNVMIVGVGGQGSLLASKLLGRLLLSKGYDIKVSEVHGMSARWTEYLKPGGKIITNTQKINPMPVIIGAAEYPEALEAKMKEAGIDLDVLDALTLATQAGSSKAVNLVLMGRLSKYFDFPEEEWMQAIEASVPPKFLEMNKIAFKLGANA